MGGVCVWCVCVVSDGGEYMGVTMHCCVIDYNFNHKNHKMVNSTPANSSTASTLSR